MERKEILKYFAYRISAIRAGRKISARKFSTELGLSEQYINQIENGHKLPSIEMLYSICEEFDMSLSEFFEEDGWRYPIEYRELYK